MQTYFCDMHIHIGGTWTGKPVKITASRQMTLTKILEEASEKREWMSSGLSTRIRRRCRTS